jgi:hypothetical protein
MQIINQDGEGEKLYLNFGRDVSTATAFTMNLQPEVGDDIDVTPVLETSDTWVGDQLMEANYFVSHTTTTDMFSDYTGRWRMKGTATISGVIYTAEYVNFMVTE